MTQLETFISERLHAYPGAVCRVATFWPLFHASLPAAERRQWPRSRVVAELAAKYPVGVAADKCLAIGGISFDPAPAWRIADGKLIRT